MAVKRRKFMMSEKVKLTPNVGRKWGVLQTEWMIKLVSLSNVNVLKEDSN
jgi:hypothetical protein